MASEEITVVDASNAILGRLASIVAKRILNGEKIAIVNAEKAVISGKLDSVLEKYKEWLKIRTHTNPKKGPFHYRRPDKLVKRVIRGMLPWKKPRGKQAYKRLRVYIGVPEEFKSKEIVKVTEIDASRLRGSYVTIFKLSQLIGWNPPKNLVMEEQ